MGEARSVGRAPRVCALQNSLVLSNGSGLHHWQNPDPASAASWGRITGPESRLEVVDLAVCPDLNGTHQQLFAATARQGIHSWTWQPDRTGMPRWVPWPALHFEPPFDGSPRALTCWSLRAGHQEVVVAGEDGALFSQRRDRWGEWSGQVQIGLVPGVRSLEAVVGSDGTVQLFALTGTELKRKVLPPVANGSSIWGDAELVATWPQPVSAQACWSLGERDDHAVLLASGELQQRQRTAGGPWGLWSNATGAGPATSLTALSGAALDPEHHLLAAASADGSVVVKQWSSLQGWTGWRLVGSATPEVPTEVWYEAGAVTIPTPPGTPSRPSGGDGSVGTERAGPAEPSVPLPEPVTRLITGRELLPLLPGERRVGPFHLVKRIGGGQQSTDKYLARDRRGYCFLKVLRPGATADEVTAFNREIEIARRVTNRHRLTTYVDHSPAQDGSPAFLALSFVAGQDLNEQLGSRRLEGAALVDLAQQLLRAVAELADCQVIHCDVKPANIIMRDATVPVLVDFGSAVTADTETVWEAAFGTSGYAAPEFSRARATNTYTDMYSWAAVVVWAATGEPPSSDAEAASQQLQRLPPVLREVVAAALQTDPTARPDVDWALTRLGPTTPLPDGLIRQRLPVEADLPSGLQERVARRRTEIVTTAAALSQWQYRGIIGIMAVAGIVLGFVAGVILRQVLEALW